MNDIFAQQPNTNIEPIEAFCVAVQEVFFWPSIAVLVGVAAYYAFVSGRHAWRILRRA